MNSTSLMFWITLVICQCFCMRQDWVMQKFVSSDHILQQFHAFSDSCRGSMIRFVNYDAACYLSLYFLVMSASVQALSNQVRLDEGRFRYFEAYRNPKKNVGVFYEDLQLREIRLSSWLLEWLFDADGCMSLSAGSHEHKGSSNT